MFRDGHVAGQRVWLWSEQPLSRGDGPARLWVTDHDAYRTATGALAQCAPHHRQSLSADDLGRPEPPGRY